MMVQRRFIAELGDIKSVTLECRKCGIRLGLSPDKIEDDDLFECPSCRHPWLSSAQGTPKGYTSETLLFLLYLVDARKAQRNGTDAAVGVRILLEFDADASQ